MTAAPLRSRRIAVPAAFDAIQDYYDAQGWTDGLPVVPATEDLVRAMLGPFGEDPGHALGIIQPRNAPVTLEKIAVNAVMAGCRPAHFPVVVAAVRAVLRPEFNVAGCQATTGGAAPVIIVNGPLAQQLQINGDAGCFGPGSRANAVIGRALRLVIRNVGGLIPGRDGQGHALHPGAVCVLLRRERGAQPLGAPPRRAGLRGGGQHGHPHRRPGGVPRHGNDRGRWARGAADPGRGPQDRRGRQFYQIGTGAQMTLVVCPEHAAEMAAAGLTKAAIRDYVYQQARMPVRQLQGLAHYGNRTWPAWVDEQDPEALVPVVRCADDVVVVVAGGDGRHSAWLAGWG